MLPPTSAQPETRDMPLLGGARAVYSGLREQSTAMRQEPGGGKALGGLLKLSLEHAEDSLTNSQF